MRKKLSTRFSELTPNQKMWARRIVVAVLVIAWLALTAIALYRNLLSVAAGVAITLPLVYLWIKFRTNRKTNETFTFYVAANEILVDGEGSRYHFEITDVIASGERIIKSMPDAPPLSRFSLGALYYSIGDHNGAVEQLGFAAEEEVLKESQYLSPSPRLRRYVRKLRKIERRPKRYAKFHAALASLEQMRHARGARLLAESQKQLRRMVETYDSQKTDLDRGFMIPSSRPLKSISAPPTISEVLSEIYHEEPKAT